MKLLSKILVALVALEHVYIMILEAFLWTTRGLKVFGMTPEFAASTKVLALNQGAYNGVLAAGLIWSMLIKDPIWARNVAMFFLSAVLAMGIVGGLSAQVSILFMQAAPALLALVVTYLGKPKN